MDKFEVTNDEMVRVMQWAYDNSKLVVSSTSIKNALGDQQELLDLDDSDCRITWSGSSFGMKSTKGAGYPCVEVTWYGSVAYCNYRSEMDGRTPCYNLSTWSCNFSANGYRLPTADEWEYAARGGLSEKRFPWGDTINHNYANYKANGSEYSYDTSPYTSSTFHPDYDDGGYPYTSPVGDFAANGYGLYDMTGNVYDWCNDWALSSVGDNSRSVRGGSWYKSYSLRCGSHDGYPPDYGAHYFGFRAACR
jgi:formylglycine-generating enzyme required for sulfatase activity